MRKRLLAQIRAHQEPGAAEMFDDVETDLKARLDMRTREPVDRICAMMSSDKDLAETSGILRSIPGIGPLAGTIPIAEMMSRRSLSEAGSGRP